MDPTVRMNLEANGYIVFTRTNYGRRLGVSTFIQRPDGSLSEFFDTLWQIPQDLDEEYDVSTYETEVPVPARNDQSHELHAQTFTVGANGELVLGIILGLVFLGIALGVLFMRTFFAGEGIAPPPCGVRGSIVEITECVKEIIYPDCSGVMYDSCQGEILDSFDAPEQPSNTFMWVAIAVIAFAAIVIVPKLIPQRRAPSYAPRQRPRPPSEDSYEFTYA